MLLNPFGPGELEKIYDETMSTYTSSGARGSGAVPTMGGGDASQSYSYLGSNAPKWREPLQTIVEGGTEVQSSNTRFEAAAFKWLELYATPSMFATADSAIVLVSKAPVTELITSDSDLRVLGFVSGFSFSTSTGVVSFSELRNEGNVIIPTKSNPGSLSLSRVLGSWENFAGRMMGVNKWAFNNQGRGHKSLFTIVVMYMTPRRTDTIGVLAFEKCFITGQSSGMQAGQFLLVENMSIIFDKVVDNRDFSFAGTNYGSKDTVPGLDGTTSSASSSNKWDIGVFYDYAGADAETTEDPRQKANKQFAEAKAVANISSIRNLKTTTQNTISKKIATNPDYKNTQEYSAYLQVIGMIDKVLPSYSTIYNADPISLAAQTTLISDLHTLKNTVNTYKNQGIYFSEI